MKMETQITTVTLNCWGIAGISKNRVDRMIAIAEELSTGAYDFAFLQEVWTTEDYERIKKRCRESLPYSHYFHSGVIGAGLCIFSCSPIVSAFFHQWALNGYMHKLQHGDWFGGKGIGMVEVLHRGLKLNLYTGHLHAEYDRVNDEYLAHRVTQAFDTAQFIKLTSQKADAVIVGGDLNTEPGDIAYRVIVHTAELRDSFFDVEVKPVGTGEALGYTCETPTNTYSSQAMLKSNPFGKRIDYILHKEGDNVQISTISCDTPWAKMVPNKEFSYSDHEAVVAKLKITKSVSTDSKVIGSASRKSALEESIEICSQALKHLSSSRIVYFLLSFFCIIFLIASVGVDFPDSLFYVVPVLRIIFIFFLTFGVFMATIWNRIEVHGILAGKLAMELEVGKMSDTQFNNYGSNGTDSKDWANAQGDTRPQINMPRFQ